MIAQKSNIEENKMITDNNVSRDTQGRRIERLTLLAANIDAVAVEIGVSGDRLAASQTCDTDYLGAISNAEIQGGQKDEAFEEFHQVVTILAELYAASKAHLLNIIWETEKPDDFMNSYGFNGRSPYRYDGLLSKITTWKEYHDILVADGDPRVLADAAMNNLVEKRDEMAAMRGTAYTEKKESRQAYDALHELFDYHTKLLQFIYTAAVLAWGDEDPRLELLGLLPASAVWTSGGGDKLPAVTGFGLEFTDPLLRLYWDAVAGADGYKVALGNNPLLLTTTLYIGPDTEYTFDPPGGHHYFKVWAMDGEDLGEPGDAIDIEIEGVQPPPPVDLVVTLLPDNKVKITWDSPGGTVYQGCSLYSVVVPTGSPVPDPGDPIYDELIVYSITLGELEPGMTRYAWVSGEHDGEVSELTGPVWVSRA